MYGRVKLEPGSLREIACTKALIDEDILRYRETLLLAKAAIKDDKVNDALQSYKEAIFPGFKNMQIDRDKRLRDDLEAFRDFKFGDVFKVYDKKLLE